MRVLSATYKGMYRLNDFIKTTLWQQAVKQLMKEEGRIAKGVLQHSKHSLLPTLAGNNSTLLKATVLACNKLI